MPDNTTRVEELRRQVYDLQQVVHGMERQLADAGDPAAAQALVDKLATAQAKAGAAEQALAETKKQVGSTAETLVGSGEVTRTRSLATTGLSVVVEPMMASVPTAFYHLLDAEEHPLVKCTVTTTAAFKRVRITSYIEGYSAQAVDTIEVRRNQAPPPVVMQQPTLFLEKVRTINELTRASLNVLAEDLDTGKIEVHKSMPIWLLARTTAPLATYDPTSGEWKDMSRYLGAFVTPNHPSVMTFLRDVAEQHAGSRLVGYQDNADVDAQVKAVFDALKSVAKIVYINSVNTFNPNTGERSQRLRLPRESLGDRQANCVDGTVLFASILEALSLNPAIVVLPSHVIVGWETAPESSKWRYLDTTKLDNRTFEEASQFGTTLAEVMEKQRAATGNERWFYRWSMRELRGTQGIYPAE
jgi:hypothetical protein